MSESEALASIAKMNTESTIDYNEYKGVPVTVNPVIATNTEGDTDLGLKMRVGSDNVSVIKSNQEKMANDLKNMEGVLGKSETKNILSE